MTARNVQHIFQETLKRYGLIEPVYSVIIDDYVNMAQNQKIKEIYDILIGQAGDSFERTEKATRELQPLLDDGQIVLWTPHSYYENCYENSDEIESDILYLVQENQKLTYTDCNDEEATVTAKVKPIKHDRYRTAIKDPFLKPKIEFGEAFVWRMSIGTSVNITIPSNATIGTYYYRFIRKPELFNINDEQTLELDSSIHEDVAKMAAYMYMEALSKKEVKDE